MEQTTRNSIFELYFLDLPVSGLHTLHQGHHKVNPTSPFYHHIILNLTSLNTAVQIANLIMYHGHVWTDRRTDGVDPLLGLLSLKRHR